MTYPSGTISHPSQKRGTMPNIIGGLVTETNLDIGDLALRHAGNYGEGKYYLYSGDDLVAEFDGPPLQEEVNLAISRFDTQGPVIASDQFTGGGTHVKGTVSEDNPIPTEPETTLEVGRARAFRDADIIAHEGQTTQAVTSTTGAVEEPEAIDDDGEVVEEVIQDPVPEDLPDPSSLVDGKVADVNSAIDDAVELGNWNYIESVLVAESEGRNRKGIIDHISWVKEENGQ